MRVVAFVCVSLVAACSAFSADEGGGAGPDASADVDRIGQDSAAGDAAATDAISETEAGDAACFPGPGICDAGCTDRCPNTDTLGPDFVMTEKASDGQATLLNEIDCHVYSCSVLVKLDDFDCSAPPIGRRGRACSVSQPCSSKFNVGISNADDCNVERCTYSCTIVY